ncbi:MAG: hypothetical protein U0175_31620 [Caldilineaceae bacterium]
MLLILKSPTNAAASGQWNQWFPIHPEVKFQPGATVTAVWANSSHLDLFATSGDGAVWSTWFEDSKGWQSWFPIYPEVKFQPGATVTAVWANSSHLDLFITGSDGAVWSTWFESEQGWQPWFLIHPEVKFQPGATVTAVWANSSHLDLFVTGSDGAVWGTWFESDKGWQPWFTIHPEVKFTPGATVTAVWANGSHLDLFLTGSDGAVSSTWYENDKGWQPWFTIHPEAKFQPGATVTAVWANDSHLDLFITGSDGAVSSTWFENDKGWQPWFAIHPEVKFQPGATVTAVWANGSHLDLFLTGSDGAVWSTWFENDKGWQPWFTIHPEVKFQPGTTVTAVWANSSHLDLFVTDSNGSVWSSFYADTTSPKWGLLANEGFAGQEMKSVYFFAGNWRCCKFWQFWFTIHPEVKFAPGATVTALWANSSHLDLFTTGSDGAVWSTWFEDGKGWQSWFPIHPEIKFQPGARVTAVWANSSHLDLFITGSDGAVWSTWFESDKGWQPWFTIHPEVKFAPGATVTAVWANSSHLDLFITNNDGIVWSTWYENDKGWQSWFSIYHEAKFQPGTTVTAVWANGSHLDLFLTGSDGAVWSTWFESDKGWQPWFLIHPEVKFQPGATVTAVWANSSHLDLFLTGSDGAVSSTWFESDKGWQPWFLIYPEVKLQPGATVTAVWANSSHLDLFVTDSDGAVRSNWFENDKGWHSWFPIYPEVKFQAGATVTALWANSSHLDLFVTGSDGAVWSSFYPSLPPVQFYEYPVGPNESLYTIHPSNPQHLGWSERLENQNFAVDTMVNAGANVVTMSYWGKRGSDRWAYWAPMHTSTYAHDQLFTAAVGKPILILPAIESGNATIGCGGHSPAYHFASDFPGSEELPAPQLVTQIEDLIHRYLKEPADPAWPTKWVKMYDRAGTSRYAINILHVASNQLAADEHERFAQGFDRVADKVFQDTGVLVGFTLDLLPEKHTVDMGDCGAKREIQDTFTPSPEKTGPYLRQQASFLAVQAFIPEIWPDISNEFGLIAYKYDYLHRWIAQGVPVILDLSPGYDAHIIFPGAKRYGNDALWRFALSGFRTQQVKGITFNTWNGYTEGYAAVPTLEFGDAAFQWIQELFKGNVPQITALPDDPIITAGKSATLTLSVADESDVAYQWYQGITGNTDSPIPSATGPSYTTPPLERTSNYWVRASSTSGSVDSATMTVNVVCCQVSLPYIAR